MITKEVVLNLVKSKGPLIPINITKELGGNTLFVGAILSELSSTKQVFISTIKIGGSPLYYVSGQEEKLQNFSNYLNEKDKRTYDLLQEKKVLRNNDQSPLVQVSLNSLRDFAKQLIIRINGVEETYFKWYLISDEVAYEYIKKDLGIVSQQKESVSKITPEIKEESDSKIKPEKKEESSCEVLQDLEKKVQEPKKENDENKVKKIDDFLETVKSFFEENSYEILKTNIEKKNREMFFELLIPFNLGNVKFYCKALKKSKINDSDISKIFVQGNIHKLPILFLYSGEITKKGKEILNTFTNFITKNVD